MISLENIKKNLLDEFTPPTLMCFRHPVLDLVFYPRQKCASTTYKELFRALNWTAIDVADINWNQDKVFAHIRDPLVQHRKGIVEGICEYFPEVEEFFLTPVGAKFLTNITIVESHSYTIEKWLGRERACAVHWIPIDTKVDHIQATFDFLESQGSPVPERIQDWFLNMPHGNQSKVNELKLYNMLMSNECPGEILRYIDFDRCLYAEVTSATGFEPDRYRDRVEQLKKTGLSESQAQEHADQEVESGQYLTWFKN